jgi:SAM-dependent methyltransferase
MVRRVLPNYFDEPVAQRYDEDCAEMFRPQVVDPAVDVLAELAGGGRALEFAIGTGRLALPLAARGVPVSGVELSPPMVDRLRAKPDADGIDVTIADMTTARVAGSFRLVYLVFNTINNLTSQAAQVECFRNASAHLEPGGAFVVEVGVPQLQRLPPGSTFQVFHATPERFGIDEYDVVAQGLVSHHYWVEDGQARIVSMPFRYVWPSELDLMARLAQMTLRFRWADWNRTAFTSSSTSHVSVWTKESGAG